jgi:hypothetical protein
MEKSVRENTCVVEVRREANTVEAIKAALVEREAGNLGRLVSSALWMRIER